MANTAARAALMTVGLVLGGCGIIGESDDLDLGTAVPDVRSDDEGGGWRDGLTTTSERDTASTTTTGPSGGSEGTFSDPQGSYELDVDPEWIPQHGSLTAEIEIWYLGRPRGPIAANLNVLTQLVPGVGLDEYVDLSVDNADLFIDEFELISAGITQGTRDELGYMEYQGTQGGHRLHFLAYFAVRDGMAVVATLTASVDEFTEARGEAEHYMQTLHALPR